ncbi:unnamed protein product [Meganyctiphanes norvegica]|uniref:F-box domain-containing protein n=1 Tax=Meganyctiphanes norvegica TaxID=48144 RepID=A0AAV2RME8_MEGNR
MGNYKLASEELLCFGVAGVLGSSPAKCMQLPDEVLIAVLAWVPAKTLLRHACLVCRRWQHLTSTHYFWITKLKTEGIHISDQNHKRIISAAIKDSDRLVLCFLQELCLKHDKEVLGELRQPRLMIEQMIEGILSWELRNDTVEFYPEGDILAKHPQLPKLTGFVVSGTFSMCSNQMEMMEVGVPLWLLENLRYRIMAWIWVEEDGIRWWFKSRAPVHSPNGVWAVRCLAGMDIGNFPWRRRGRHTSYTAGAIFMFML